MHVDDGIIISHNNCQLNALIDKLCACKIDFVVEEDYAGYLEVDIITQTTDGTILMSQTDLIERILLDLAGAHRVSKFQGNTPRHRSTRTVQSSPPLIEVYNYRSILGKIMYLSSNMHSCEMSLANHQCARLFINPRAPHGIALKRIDCYLLGTRDKALIVCPTTDLLLNCYAHANFAGLFSSSDPDDPKSVKSCSGFVITLGSHRAILVLGKQTTNRDSLVNNGVRIQISFPRTTCITSITYRSQQIGNISTSQT